MLTEQVKRRAPFEIKDKFLDEWYEIKKASYLAEKCDKYESVRGNVRKLDNKIWNNKPYFRDRNGQVSARSKGEQAVKSGGDDKKDHMRRNSWNNDKFDRKKPITY